MMNTIHTNLLAETTKPANPTRETLKLKLKAMRCRIKQKHQEFLQMNSSTALTTSHLEKHYNLFSPEDTQCDRVKLAKAKCPKRKNNDIDAISIEISFTRNQANLEQNSKTSSRTSTPIFNEPAKKKSSRQKHKFSLKANVINSTILIKNKTAKITARINKKKFRQQTNAPCLPPPPPPASTLNRFFDLEANNFYNYRFPTALPDSCSQCNFYCYESDLISMPNSMPCEFEDYGDFKVWYV